MTAVQPRAVHKEVCGPVEPNERRQQHQREHGEEILDDEPADGDVPGLRVQVVVVGEDAHQDDRARDRQRHAEDQPGRPVPSRGTGDHGAERRGDPALHDRSGDGDAADGNQFFDMELKADAEHQQDDADFGQLLGQRRVGHEARGVGSDQRTGKQVAHERRQANSVGDVAQEQRRGEPAGERED